MSCTGSEIITALTITTYPHYTNAKKDLIKAREKDLGLGGGKGDLENRAYLKKM